MTSKKISNPKNKLFQLALLLTIGLAMVLTAGCKAEDDKAAAVAATGDVTEFTATAGDASVTLAWTDPTTADFVGVRVCWASASPTDPEDCANEVDVLAGEETITVSGLADETEYFFTAFAYDSTPTYTPGATASATTNAAGGGGNGGGNGGGTPVYTTGADWDNIYTTIFSVNCSCHDSAGGSGGLTLQSGDYATVVTNQQASSQTTLYIDTTPATSYLYLKITDDAAIAGAAMPMGGYPMAQANIDLISTWIEEGAIEVAP